MGLLTKPFLDDDEDVATVQEFATAGARTGASLGARTGASLGARTGPVGAGVGAGFGGAVGYFVGYGVTGVAPGRGSRHGKPVAPDDGPVALTVTDEAAGD